MQILCWRIKKPEVQCCFGKCVIQCSSIFFIADGKSMDLGDSVQDKTFVIIYTGPLYRYIDLFRECTLLEERSFVKAMTNVIILTFSCVRYGSGEFGDTPSRLLSRSASEVRKPRIFATVSETAEMWVENTSWMRKLCTRFWQ